MSAETRSAPVAEAVKLDLSALGVREANQQLKSRQAASYRLLKPGGMHAIAAGLDDQLDVEVDGHAGYYCAGMNQHARVRVLGNVGVGVAENMMSGRVEVEGSAGQSAAATAHGGLLVVHGNAAGRCAISLKGADVVVAGSIGHASAFMAQSGRLLVAGDAGEGLGDSIYEARLYVRGSVAGLGADCVEKELREEHVAEVAELIAAAGLQGVEPRSFRRYGSARALYHWNSAHKEGH